MSKSIVYILLLSSVLLFNLSKASNCSSECQSSEIPFSNKKIINLKKYTGTEPDPNIFFIDPKTGKKPKTFNTVTPTSKFFGANGLIKTDVIINGKNYGKILAKGDRIWLNSDVSAIPGTEYIANGCPIGTRAPYFFELNSEYHRIISEGEEITDFFTAGKFYITTDYEQKQNIIPSSKF